MHLEDTNVESANAQLQPFHIPLANLNLPALPVKRCSILLKILSKVFSNTDSSILWDSSDPVLQSLFIFRCAYE
jgi:hypothetical protein